MVVRGRRGDVGRWLATVVIAVGLSGGASFGVLGAAWGCESDSGNKTNTTPGAGQDAAGGDGAAQQDTPSTGDGSASAATCTCETPGATLSSTCDWPDAEQCSGWVSMTVDNDPALKAQEESGDYEAAMAAALAKPFPSATEQCAFGCCTTITCP